MVQQVWRNLKLASANLRFRPEHDVFETLKKHCRQVFEACEFLQKLARPDML